MFGLRVLTELKNSGAEVIFFVTCGGLKGLPNSVGSVRGQPIVQTCAIHLIRNTFRYASKKYWGQIATDLRCPDKTRLEGVRVVGGGCGECAARYSAEGGATEPDGSHEWDL